MSARLAERYAQRMIFLADGKLIDDRPNAPTAVILREGGHEDFPT